MSAGNLPSELKCDVLEWDLSTFHYIIRRIKAASETVQVSLTIVSLQIPRLVSNCCQKCRTPNPHLATSPNLQPGSTGTPTQPSPPSNHPQEPSTPTVTFSGPARNSPTPQSVNTRHAMPQELGSSLCATT